MQRTNAISNIIAINRSESIVNTINNFLIAGLHPKMNLKFISSVPPSNSSVFGQIGGVGTSEEGDVYVFHRGSVIWNSL